MNKLGERNWLLLEDGLKTCGWNIHDVLGYCMEGFDIDEYEIIQAFLFWCDGKDYRLGWANYERRFAEFITDQQKVDAYKEKRAAKAERFRERAGKARERSDEARKRSDALVEHIPFGQPILVGHHSEKSHRNTLKRSRNAMFKSIDESNKAKYYDRRAKTVETNKAIFSDDPEAIRKLKEKIAQLETNHKAMKDFNKAMRKNDMEGMKAAGFDDATIRQLLNPKFDYMKKGFASYSLSNNKTNINRNKKRLAELEAKQGQETKTTEYGDIQIVENVEDNRVQVFFPGKPSESVRTKLKSGGFRWSRYNGCWQRHLTKHGVWKAQDIVKEVQGE